MLKWIDENKDVLMAIALVVFFTIAMIVSIDKNAMTPRFIECYSCKIVVKEQEAIHVKINTIDKYYCQKCYSKVK
jgi:hypothetical protein